MSNGLGKPPAGAFGARVLSRFFDGLTQRYQRGEAEKREDELSRKERQQGRRDLMEERAYQENLTADEEKRERVQMDEDRFWTRRTEKKKISRQNELLDRKEAEAIAAEKRAQADKIEIQELRNSVLGINKPTLPPKPKTEPQEMRDFATVWGDQFERGDIRGIVKEKRKFGLTDEQAIGRYKGRYLAGDVLEETVDSFFQWGKKPTDKFINGNDLLIALAPYGFGGEIVGLDPNTDYSAEEAIILITSAQEDPVAFAKSSEVMENLKDIIYDLLEQTYDPPEGEATKAPKELVGVGKAFIKAFGKSSRAGTIPRLP